MSRATAIMKDEDGRLIAGRRPCSVSIHRVTADDIGRSSGGLLYTCPEDTLHMVNSKDQIVLRLGDNNTVFLNDLNAAKELVAYLTAAIDSIGQTNNQ